MKGYVIEIDNMLVCNQFSVEDKLEHAIIFENKLLFQFRSLLMDKYLCFC